MKSAITCAAPARSVSIFGVSPLASPEAATSEARDMEIMPSEAVWMLLTMDEAVVSYFFARASRSCICSR